MMIHHRSELLKIRNGFFKAEKLLALSSNFFEEHDIRILALDFDGVMASHGENIPSNEVLVWLERLIQWFPEENIYILSNKPTIIRKHFFQKAFPKINFICDIPKKPYPDGIKLISHHSGSNYKNIALIDDRLLTGCLACIIAGARAVWITKPYVNFKKRPISELCFFILRLVDKIVV